MTDGALTLHDTNRNDFPTICPTCASPSGRMVSGQGGDVRCGDCHHSGASRPAQAHEHEPYQPLPVRLWTGSGTPRWRRSSRRGYSNRCQSARRGRRRRSAELACCSTGPSRRCGAQASWCSTESRTLPELLTIHNYDVVGSDGGRLGLRVCRGNSDGPPTEKQSDRCMTVEPPLGIVRMDLTAKVQRLVRNGGGQCIGEHIAVFSAKPSEACWPARGTVARREWKAPGQFETVRHRNLLSFQMPKRTIMITVGRRAHNPHSLTPNETTPRPPLPV